MARYAPARPITDREGNCISHCNKGLNAKFTVLNNSG